MDVSLGLVLLGAVSLAALVGTVLLLDPRLAGSLYPGKVRESSTTLSPSSVPVERRSVTEVYEQLDAISSAKTAYRRTVQGGLTRAPKPPDSPPEPETAEDEHFHPLRPAHRSSKK